MYTRWNVVEYSMVVSVQVKIGINLLHIFVHVPTYVQMYVGRYVFEGIQAIL